MKIKIFLAALPLLAACTGCTLVSCDHTFPKLDWYWSSAAIDCREEHRQEKQWENQAKTNQIPASVPKG